MALFLALPGCGGGGGGDAAVPACSYTGTGNTATVSWTPPATSSNGTALTDLAGYRVYYGTSSGAYIQSLDVGNVTTYQVTGLPGGATYYFAVTAYDTSRNESAYSAEVCKRLQ